MLKMFFRSCMSNCRAALCLLAAGSFFLWPAVTHAAVVHLSDHAGGTSGQEFATSVCGVPDFDGDGRDEILIGAPGHSNTGAAFLWHGQTQVTHSPAASWYGAADEQFGFSVAAIGDVNHDGNQDFAIGAPLANSPGADSGRICIFYGGASLSGTPDLVIGGENAGDQFGYSVAPAGDFNGDGKDDFIVGAPYSNRAGLDAGAAYVIFGNQGDPDTDLSSAVILVGEGADDHFGWSVCAAGNFLGGNEQSVAVGAPGNNTHGGTDAGAVYVYQGSVYPSAPNSAVDHELSVGGSYQPGSFFGWSVRLAGRWDGDGYDDLAVGAPGNNDAGTDAGRLEIIFGDPSPSATGDRYALGATAGDQLGYALSRLGDFTGNGREDLLAGAPYFSGDATAAGRAYIYAGGSNSGNASVLTAVPVDPLVPGNAANNEFGFSVAGLGDFDGDGSLDFAVGAPGGQIADGTPAGYCRVLASDSQTVANFNFQLAAHWNADGQVSLDLDLPLAPVEISDLEIRRLTEGTAGPLASGILLHQGSAQDLLLADDTGGPTFSYRLLDAGPFVYSADAAALTYQVTILTNTGNWWALPGSAPLALDQQPTRQVALARPAWPNPANPRTALDYRVEGGKPFQLTIRDLRGHLVRRLVRATSDGQWRQSSWDGCDDQGRALPSGLYFFYLQAGDQQVVRKVVLAR